jgi:transketolase
MEIKDLKDIAAQVRRDIVRMVYNAQSGHPGGSLGCADFFTALYFKVMDRKEGFDMNGKDEDIFFLSNGHISPVWYSTLAHAGYFPIKELDTYRKIDSRVQGHPATARKFPCSSDLFRFSRTDNER